MFIHRQKQKGMVLICAVAILAVLSIMATSFVRMMTLNLQAAKNHLNYVDAKFAAIAGIEDAKARIWEEMLKRNTNLPQHYQNLSNNDNDAQFRDNNFYNDKEDGYRKDGWYEYNDKDDNNLKYYFYEGTIGRTDNNGHKIGRYDRHGNRYKFRIRSNQGKLNLNSHRPYDLDYSTTDKGKETKRRIKNSNRVMNTIIKCLAEACEIENATKLAEELRPIDENIKTFNSMQEVELILQSYGTDEQRADFLNNVCVNSVMDSLCYVPTYTTTSFQVNRNNQLITVNRDNLDINEGNTTYYREYRSPININSISKKLLTALIQSINATVYIYSPYHTTVDDYGFIDSGTNKTESSFKYAIAKYAISFSQSDADTIADSILKSKPYTSMAHIESEIQKLSITNISSLINVSYLIEVTPQNYINDVRLTNILKDTLKANFNPNIKENFYNGTHVSARYVQKSDLYSSGNPTHSTELCILDCGYADIESNGIIQARVTSDNPVTVAKASIKESISFGTIMSLTSYNDFSTNNNAWIFPELSDSENTNKISSYMKDNLKSVCGYIQGKYHEYTGESPTTTSFVKAKDGLLMKSSFAPAEENVYTPSSKNYAPSQIEASSIVALSGSLSFWVKLTEDWYEPTMCALFSASYRNTNQHSYIKYPVSYGTDGKSIPSYYHDGIQMYIYKNTKGELRLSRLYFCGYFNNTENFDSGNKNKNYYGIESLAVDVPPENIPNQNIKYARRDICIDLSSANEKWKANEWHHIYVYWNDVSSSKEGFYAKIDKDRKYECMNVGDLNSETKPQFCILNEYHNLTDETKNGNTSSLIRIQMNSMKRNQYKSQGNMTNDKRLFRFKDAAYLPGNSTINTNVSSNADTIKSISSYSITFNFSTLEHKDPNKNPFLSYECKKNQNNQNSNTANKQVTTWGIIGALNWIGYPEEQCMHSYPNNENSTLNPTLSNGYIKMKSDIHNETSGSTTTIIPPTRSTVLGTSFSCSAEFQNASKYPTVLDSVTLHIMYPVVFSSTIVQ